MRTLGGASLQDCVRLTVYVSDLRRFAPLVDEVQAELGKAADPPRTMVEVRRLFDDDIVEIDSVFYAQRKMSRARLRGWAYTRIAAIDLLSYFGERCPGAERTK